MIPPVRIDFQVGGVADVHKAFQSVQDATAKASRARASYGKTTENGFASLGKVAEKAARDEVKASDSAAKSKAKSADKAAKEIAATERQLTAVYKTEQGKRETELRQSLRRQTQYDKEYRRAIMRTAAETEKQIARERERYSKAIGTGMSGAMQRGTSHAVRMGTGLAGGLLGLGGGFSIQNVLGNEFSARGMAADIANAGWLPQGGGPNATKRSTDEIMNAAKNAGQPMGFDKTETLSGLSTFVGKTGDLDKGMALLPQLAQLARATGADFHDVASAAGEIFNSDTNQSAETLMMTLRGIAAQGQLGAVEIKDLAVQMSKVTASAGQFSGDKQKNVLTLGAMAQEAKARGGATSAADATTAVARFASDVEEHERKFLDLGVHVKDGKLLRGPQQIVMDTLKATGGDVTKINSLFGDRSSKAVRGFAEIYRNAGGGNGDEKKDKVAMAAVVAEFDHLQKAIMTEADERKRAMDRMEEADMQWGTALMALRDAVATELLPELTKLAPEFVKLVPLARDLADGLVAMVEKFRNNPLGGVGTVVGVAFAAELAKAGVAKLMEKAFSSAAGQGIAIVSAAIAVEQLGELIIQQDIDRESKHRETLTGDTGEAQHLQRKIESGKATPADIEKAKQLVNKIGQEREQVKTDQANPSFMKQQGLGFASIVAPDETVAAMTNEKKQAALQDFEATKAMAGLTVALQRNTDATLKNTSAPNAPNAPHTNPGHPSRGTPQ